MRRGREQALRAAAPALAVAAATQRLDELALKVSRALRAAGVPHLILRGPAIARWLYDQPGDRRYGDVDVLVPPDAFERSMAELEAIGLQMRGAESAPGEWPAHARTFDGAVGAVDLHRTIRGPAVGAEAVWAELSRGAEEIPAGDGALPVPATAARAFLISVHAAQHGPEGVVQREDVARALERVPAETWREAAQIARRLGAEAWFAGGLSAMAGGPELVRDLGLTAGSDPHVEVRAAGEIPIARRLAELAEVPGTVAKARLLAREVVPTRTFMRDWAPLARRGRGGLAAAYLMRPFWMIWHLPRALIVYRRASRSVRDGDR